MRRYYLGQESSSADAALETAILAETTPKPRPAPAPVIVAPVKVPGFVGPPVPKGFVPVHPLPAGVIPVKQVVGKFAANGASVTGSSTVIEAKTERDSLQKKIEELRRQLQRASRRRYEAEESVAPESARYQQLAAQIEDLTKRKRMLDDQLKVAGKPQARSLEQRLVETPSTELPSMSEAVSAGTQRLQEMSFELPAPVFALPSMRETVSPFDQAEIGLDVAAFAAAQNQKIRATGPEVASEGTFAEVRRPLSFAERTHADVEEARSEAERRADETWAARKRGPATVEELRALYPPLTPLTEEEKAQLGSRPPLLEFIGKAKEAYDTAVAAKTALDTYGWYKREVEPTVKKVQLKVKIAEHGGAQARKEAVAKAKEYVAQVGLDRNLPEVTEALTWENQVSANRLEEKLTYLRHAILSTGRGTAINTIRAQAGDAAATLMNSYLNRYMRLGYLLNDMNYMRSVGINTQQDLREYISKAAQARKLAENMYRDILGKTAKVSWTVGAALALQKSFGYEVTSDKE